MKTIFLKELKFSRRSLALWCCVIGLTALFGMLEYPFISRYIGTLAPVLSSMPKLVQIMFGIYRVDFSTALGYYVCMYFWCCLLTYTHAVYLGASIISRDQRDKTSEYIFTKPYKRGTIVSAKAMVAAVNAFAAASVTGLLAVAALMLMKVGPEVLLKVAVSILGMFFTQLVLVALGLLCSALSSKYKTSVLSAVAVLIAAYTVAMAIEYAGTVDYLNFLSPIRYFNALSVVEKGLNISYVGVSAGIIAVSLFLTHRFYRKKDIPV